MASWETYKNDIEVPDTPTGDAGIKLKADLKKLRDYAPKSDFAKTTNPTSSDNFAASWEPGSRWLNTTSKKLWTCYADGSWQSNSPLVPTSSKTSSYTAVLNDLVLCNVSSTSFTVTAPAAPVDGSRFGVFLHTRSANTNKLTIAPNTSQTLRGNNLSSGNVILTSVNDYVEFSYNAGTSEWIVVSDSRDSTLVSTATKTGNYTVTDNELVVCNISSSSFTVTAPAAPVDGSRFSVFLRTKGTNANKLTIAPNTSQTLRGNNLSSGNVILTSVDDYVEFSYNAGTSEWMIVSDSRDTTPVTTATKTGNYTVAGNELVVCNASSTSFTVTLQDEAANNTRVGVYLASTSSSRTVTITNPAASAPKIIGPNGDEGASILLYVVGDYVELQYLGSGTWLIVSDRRVPHVCEITGPTSSPQSINDATDTQLDLSATEFDNAGLADTSNDRIVIRRAGKYRVNGYLGLSNANMFRLQLTLQVNGADSRIGQTGSTGVSAQWFGFNSLVNLAANDVLTLFFYQDNTDNAARSLSTAGRSRPRLAVEEVR